MSNVAEAARPATDPAHPASAGGRPSLLRFVAVIVLAALLVALPFAAGGGVDETVASSGNTWTEIALTLAGVAVIGWALVFGPAGARRSGSLAVGLMAVLFALTAASIAWSVAPDSSWLASGQLLAYLLVFAATVIVAQRSPGGWRVVLGGLLLSIVAVSVWSLAVKVFPATLAPNNQVGRLQAPFGYWNALAVSAAMGVPGCLWLGARRDAGRWAWLAAPAASVLVAVLVLSYSRSADLAAVVAVALWLVFVPLRLRAAAVLLLGLLGGAAISVWALVHHDLTRDNVAPAAQDHAGHPFGVVLLVVLVAVTALGAVALRRIDRETLAPQARRRIGLALVGAVAACVVVGLVGLALSSRGLPGEVSHGWQELTNPTASAGDNAGRVFDFGSSRPLYWHEALAVGDHSPLKGVGASGFWVARLLYGTESTQVFQAHSYVFQTYADLGILGLAVTAALLAAWLAATGRTLGRSRWRELTAAQQAERAGLATLAALVVAFGVQSTLDWTWYFSAIAVPALIAAGWLAGRGPLTGAPVPAAGARAAKRAGGSPLDRPAAVIGVPVLVAAALLASWMVWRPLHSAQIIASVENGTASDAAAAADSAHSADPLSLYPFQLKASLYESSGRLGLAAAELQRATTVQPRNPFAYAPLAKLYVDHKMWAKAIPQLHEVNVLDRTPDPMTTENDLEIQDVFLPGHYTPPGS